jgi:hypothetical protein
MKDKYEIGKKKKLKQMVHPLLIGHGLRLNVWKHNQD